MKKALIGNGGHAIEVRSQIGEGEFFVTDYSGHKGARPISELDFDSYELMICVGDPTIRKKIADSMPSGCRFFTYIHPTAIIGEGVEIGEGSFIGPYCVLTTNIKIGKHSIILRNSCIGHDSAAGDFLSMMANCSISGNVTIGERSYLGNNCSVKEKKNICDGVTIGMNSCVVKDILEPGIYAGTPSKKIR